MSQILATTFFPATSGITGLYNIFCILLVSYLSRPFGSVVIGLLNYRIGRKKMLILSVILIGTPKPLELEYKSKVYELEESKKMAYISFIEKLGMEKDLMNAAKHLLEDGAKPAYVKKITGLSLTKIKQLQQKLKQKIY
jgi:hypothetical protein